MRVKCECGALLKVPDSMMGKRVRCPKCKAPIELSEGSAGQEEFRAQAERKAAGDKVAAKKPSPPAPPPAPPQSPPAPPNSPPEAPSAPSASETPKTQDARTQKSRRAGRVRGLAVSVLTATKSTLSYPGWAVVGGFSVISVLFGFGVGMLVADGPETTSGTTDIEKAEPQGMEQELLPPSQKRAGMKYPDAQVQRTGAGVEQVDAAPEGEPGDSGPKAGRPNHMPCLVIKRYRNKVSALFLFDYDDNGRISRTARQVPTKDCTDLEDCKPLLAPRDWETDYEYDPDGRLKRTVKKLQDGNETLSISYSDAGRVTAYQWREPLMDGGHNTEETTVMWDQSGNVVEANRSGQMFFRKMLKTTSRDVFRFGATDNPFRNVATVWPFSSGVYFGEESSVGITTVEGLGEAKGGWNVQFGSAGQILSMEHIYKGTKDYVYIFVYECDEVSPEVDSGVGSGNKTAGPVTPENPQCKEDCAKIGFCGYKNGKCYTRNVDDCRQAEICRLRGACSIERKDYKDGTYRLYCRALSDEDCKESQDCKEKGECVEADGYCINPKDSKTARMRVTSVNTIRSTAWAAAADCEVMKHKIIPLLAQEYSQPRTIWADLDGASQDVVNVIVQWRMSVFPSFDASKKMVAGDCDLLGEPCCSDLRADVEKVRKECFFDGGYKNLDWIMKAGGTACGPTTTPGLSHCGQDGALTQAKRRPHWNEYSCQFKEDVGAQWDECISYRAYTTETINGCPGNMKCCPRSDVLDPDQGANACEQFRTCCRAYAKALGKVKSVPRRAVSLTMSSCEKPMGEKSCRKISGDMLRAMRAYQSLPDFVVPGECLERGGN